MCTLQLGSLFLFAFVFNAHENVVQSEPVLLLPMSAGYSHVAKLIPIGEELVQLGHDVTIALADKDVIHFAISSKMNVIIFKSTVNAEKEVKELNLKASVYQLLVDIYSFSAKFCDDMFSDKTFMKNVENRKYQMIVLDGSPFSRCLAILPQMFDIPFVSEAPYCDNALAGVPVIPSVGPRILFPYPHESHSTIYGRFTSIVEAILFTWTDHPVKSTWLIDKYLPSKKGSSFLELMREARFWLYGNGEPLLDSGLISTPNVAFVGGLTTKPAKRLPQELETFMESVSNGVIVMSFGSLPMQLSTEFYQMFFDAFARLDLKVIMRVPSPESLKPSSNVLLRKWMPQNDLLGHNKTRIFITHCGANGQYEALYHGVPMLGIPIMPSDQQYNAQRMQARGYGIALDFHSLTTELIYDALLKLTQNSTYTDRIKNASLAFRSADMSPRKRAAFWVDYVIKHGAAHLRPPSLDMPLWQYALLDMVAIFFGILIISSSCLFFSIRFVYRKFFDKNPKTRKKID